MQQHEIFELGDDDLNGGDKSATVHKSKTAAGRRTIPLTREAQIIVAEQRLSRPPGVSLIFPTPMGMRWGKDNFNHRVFGPARATLGDIGERLTFHDLRHTFASLMIAAGTHPKTLQVLMGHKESRVTMDTYGHLYEGAEAAAIEQFERFPRRTACPISAPS